MKKLLLFAAISCCLSSCATLPVSTQSAVQSQNLMRQSLANLIHAAATTTPDAPAVFNAKVDELVAVVPSLKAYGDQAKALYAQKYPSIVAGQSAVRTVESIAALFDLKAS